MPRLHAVFITHTTRHLACSLASLARQQRMPDTVTLSCDVDDPSIVEAAQQAWEMMGESLTSRGATLPDLRVITRAHTGLSRSAQVRNNGVRALLDGDLLEEQDHIAFFDADVLLDERAMALHAELGAAGRELVIPFRVDLDEGATQGVTVESVIGGSAPLGSLMSDHARQRLAKRQSRYSRQLLLRNLSRFVPGVVKPHKPKVISCNFSVSARAYLAVNGFDEQFEGYGWEDDDLGMRLYALRPRIRAAVPIEDLRVYHLFHPTRDAGRPSEFPGYARYTSERPIPRADRGVENPLEQPEPRVTLIEGRSAKA